MNRCSRSGSVGSSLSTPVGTIGETAARRQIGRRPALQAAIENWRTRVVIPPPGNWFGFSPSTVTRIAPSKLGAGARLVLAEGAALEDQGDRRPRPREPVGDVDEHRLDVGEDSAPAMSLKPCAFAASGPVLSPARPAVSTAVAGQVDVDIVVEGRAGDDPADAGGAPVIDAERVDRLRTVRLGVRRSPAAARRIARRRGRSGRWR